MLYQKIVRNRLIIKVFTNDNVHEAGFGSKTKEIRHEYSKTVYKLMRLTPHTGHAFIDIAAKLWGKLLESNDEYVATM